MKNWGAFVFTFTLCAVLTGCTTVEFVRKDTSPVKQGVLRYSPPSNADREKKYRAEVDKKATEFCNGKYKITKEYQAKDMDNTSSGVGTGFSFGSGAIMVGSSTPNRSMYSFVEFICD